MARIFKTLVLAAGLAAVSAGSALAAPRAVASTTPEPPRCSRQLGAITIVDGQRKGWETMGLPGPITVLRPMIQRSGCFRIVERGVGLEVAQQERSLAGGGDLQRGSNVGRGQMRAADYMLIAEVAAQDANSGGGAVAGAIGGIVGGRFGALASGLRVRNQNAQAILSLTDVRTTETVAVTEGNAANRDISWGAGGWLGGGGLGGGAYADTEVGRVVSMAFIDAYTQLVNQLGGVSDTPAADAAPRAYRTTTRTNLRSGPSTSSRVVRTLPAGAMIYPSGEREGMWWAATDENDNRGWIQNSNLEPAR
ncbi:MAG: hypothetical protein JNJ73_06645 [Hyphomonadaceae bacterium]|nr:hypothetical protein [Hyphomonadaceae bacterium]